MQTYSGVGVTPGRVVGRVRKMPAPLAEPPAGQQLGPDTTPEAAIAALKAAAVSVQADLRSRAERATGDGKAVLEATALMAADPMLLKSAGKKINNGLSAERAVWDAADGVATMLLNLGGYMAERSHDVLDVRSRIVAELRGIQAPGIPESAEPFILVAEDLAPADTATLDPRLVIALVTSGGGPQSHTAIIARNLGLPAVVAAHGITEVADNTEIYVDAAAGSITVAPDQELRLAATAWAEKSSLLNSFDGEGRLADGTKVPLLANVGGAKDAQLAASAGAEGVGLFRTEFLFLDRGTEPTFEEQQTAYAAVFAAFAGRKVVVRTLDAGADKPLPFLTDASEPNPALGVRGYRTELSAPGVLGRQLKAIAAAAAESDAEVWVMAPMIATAGEAADFAALCQEAGLRTPGVMVEIPSAALMARHLLAEVTFASLGTNDLTQYTMAADRQLGPLASLNDPWQPAVLSLVAATVAGADAHGGTSVKSVGVCGESAADPALAVVLVGLGVSTLSMSARSLAAVAAVLATVTLETARELAALALAAPSATAARTAVRSQLPILASLGL